MPHLLVVDDSKFNRGRVLAALKDGGYRFSEAADGEEALRLVEADPPDLIVSDLLMPRLDGHGFLLSLRERKIDVPVLILSADIQSSSRELCEQAGAAGFLNKPIKPEQLAESVRTLLNSVMASR